MNENSYSQRYKFTDCIFDEPALGGFTITGKDRVPVTVALYPHYWGVRSDEKPSIHGVWEDYEVWRKYGLYSFGDLVNCIADTLMHDWEPPEGRKPWPGLKDWAIQQTTKSISKRVHKRWERLLKRVDPDVLAVHRAVYAATNGSGCNEKVLRFPGLYKRKFIVSDVINYRAAVAALLNIEILAYYQKRNLNGLEVDFYKWRPHPDQLLDAMENWMSLFSADGKPYRSLRRTLMNLPGGVPVWHMGYLLNVRLERPIIKRAEMLVLLRHLSNLASDDRHSNEANNDILENTREGDIREALRRVENYTHADLPFRRYRSICYLVDFLDDYPGAHRGNIVGLADASIRWHRDEQERVREETIEKLGIDAEAHKPPVPLPTDQRVRFLENVDAICQEAKDMDHCIASYAEKAVQGRCYLFHVEHEGERATVEVNYTGKVAQARGPKNGDNRAAKWGKKFLNRWGANIPRDVGLPRILQPAGDMAPPPDFAEAIPF